MEKEFFKFDARIKEEAARALKNCRQDFETIEDPETGVIKFIGTVKILVDKEKKERE